MNMRAIGRRSVGLCVACAASLAAAPTSALAAGCNAPALGQVFSWANDTNWYAALPGETWDNFAATGWTVSGGAKIVSTTLADGKKGSVVDLVSGAKAVSPAMCVTNDYPSARGEIRNLHGSAGVSVSISYMGSSAWGPSQPTGTVTGINTGWTLPKAISIKQSAITGWQLAQFTFVAAGSSAEYQLSNFYVDPRLHH
jgi:hypothetical protein